MSVHYVRNENGFIHSVDDEHFENVLHFTSPTGRRHMLSGWSEVDEKTARKEEPTLFGAPDPNVRMTAAEIQDARQRRQWEQEIAAESEGK